MAQRFEACLKGRFVVGSFERTQARDSTTPYSKHFSSTFPQDFPKSENFVKILFAGIGSVIEPVQIPPSLQQLTK